MLSNPIQLLGMLQNAQNPMMLLKQAFSKHPRFNQVMQVVETKNPQQLEQYTRNLAKNQNVDLSKLAGMFGFKI